MSINTSPAGTAPPVLRRMTFTRFDPNDLLRLTLPMILLAAGCGDLTWPTRSAQSASNAASPGDPAGSAPSATSGNDPTVVVMSFDVLRVDLPLGDVQHSLKIWNHVDESNEDPVLPALLARNGYRLGVARQDAWPALRAIFGANQARSVREQQSVRSGQAALIKLGEVKDGQVYFVQGRAGSLYGGTFDAGERVLEVEYAFDERDPRRCVLRITPETRNARTERKLVSQGDELQTVEVRGGKTFDELEAKIVLSPGEFLVIGSGEKAAGGCRIGSAWFQSQLGVQRFETVVCISPQPFRLQ